MNDVLCSFPSNHYIIILEFKGIAFYPQDTAFLQIS